MLFKPLFLSAAIVALCAGLSPAAATTTRTFVSGKGADSNACTINAPCRSFQQAVSQTAPGGEVVALDPAGYGVVTLTQSISLVNDGVGTVSISVPANGTGVTISIGPNDSVHLRGIEIDGNNAGQNQGVFVTNGGIVELLNTVVRHTNVGFVVSAAAYSVNAAIRKSTISDNVEGLDIEGGAFSVALDDVQVANNTQGIGLHAADNQSNVNIRRCFISASPSSVSSEEPGIGVVGGRVLVSDSEVTGFYIGLRTDNSNANAVIGVDRSTITENTFGLYNHSGTIFTYSNNAINYNTSSDEQGSITHYTPE